MTTIPDSFSPEDLAKALASAPKEKAELNGKQYKEMINDLSQKHLSAAYDDLQDPVLHKTMALDVVVMLFNYHMNQSETALEAGNAEAAACWMRDAGMLQSVAHLLTNISVSDKDFTCKH